MNTTSRKLKNNPTTLNLNILVHYTSVLISWIIIRLVDDAGILQTDETDFNDFFKR